MIKMNRVYNFSAGPSVLPVPVLEKAQKELLCYEDSGMSVMEMSQRSSVYQKIIDDCEALLRELLNIPENYKVLFLQGGASSQFAMIPLNLFKNKKADFINTGMWSKKAAKEASKFGVANIVASSEDKTFNYIAEHKNPADSNEINLSKVCKIYDPPYLISTNVYNYIKEHINEWVEEAIKIRSLYP